jgi:exoribonuclease R
LVAYDISVGFNKSYKNKYVTFSYHHWTDKHPIGVLSQTIGDVHDLPSFNEYQLYCKQLQTSIKPAVTLTNNALRVRPISSYQTEILENPKRFGSMVNLLNDNNRFIFTVDPTGCTDRDDALSIASRTNGEVAEHLVSVHIANVWVWLEALGLSDHLGNRVSTIYFPEMKRPMLPIKVGEELCSLDEGKVCFAFSMDFTVIEHPKKGVYIQYLESMRPNMYQSAVQVSKNFVYEEPSLIGNRDYKSLKEVTQKLDKHVKNSHDVVAFWMIQMNRYTAKHMKSERFGIFRTVQSKKDHDFEDHTDEKLPLIVRLWEQHLGGEYVVYSNKIQNLSHAALGYAEYVHITSPIRRMVDLLNQLAWVKHHIKEVEFSDALNNFYEKQLGNMAVLNVQMKKIRKIQSDAHILFIVTNDPHLLNREFKGIVLAKGREDNKMQSTVYIEELKWMSQCTLPEKVELHETISCKIFVFEKEDKMTKKVRVQLVI